MRTLNIETPTHGRVVVRDATEPSGVLLGFHGYTENAEIQMDRLVSIRGADRWTLISVQGLHRFYRGRTQEISASWMTRQDREFAIADNIEYVNRIVREVAPPDVPLVCAGFSQGVAMAFRGGVRGERRASAIIAVGGDVPPELLEDADAQFPRVLLCRGRGDEWYTDAKLNADLGALRGRGADVRSLVYDAGHDWTEEVSIAAGEYLRVGDSHAPRR